MILAEAENQKNAFLLNAISQMLNNPIINQEAENLIAEIQTTLAENQIDIPEQPDPAFDRPPSSIAGSER